MKSKNSECKALVVWGKNLPSLVGEGRLTKQMCQMISLPPFIRDVIVGLLLSDGWLILSSTHLKNSTNLNARLGFAQSGDHAEYFWFVFFVCCVEVRMYDWSFHNL